MPALNIKSKDMMLTAVLDSLQQNAGVSSISPGSIARAFAEAITTEISDLYSALKLSVEQSSLSTASGVHLDSIGQLYGVSRRSIADELVQDRVVSNIEFMLDKPHISNIVIPKGTLVYNNVDTFNDIQRAYEVVADIIIPAGLTREYGSVRAKFPSNNITASINTLLKHNYISPPGIVVMCTNPKEVYASINSESDDNYRKRIIAAVRSSSAGTAESIRFAALAVRGIKDAKVREGSYGIGSCDLIIVPEGTSAIGNLPEVVRTAVNGIKPMGIRLNVRMAKKKNVDVSVTVTLRQGTSGELAKSIEAQSRIFLSRYLNSLTIGATLSVKDIESQIKFASDAIVGVSINSLSVDRNNIPGSNYKLSDDRSYMGTGSISVYSVIIGSSSY